jgi:small subunit ribosomal protein S1
MMNTEIDQVIQPTPESPAVLSLEDLKPKMELRGKVTRIELYGAFVDLGVGVDGLLHISQLSADQVRNVNDVVKIGDEVTVWARQVDQESKRIDLTMIKPAGLTWDEIKVGQELTGTVVRLEKYGVFLDVGAERPGMIHVSELTNGYVNNPSEVVRVGDELHAKVIKVSSKKKQLDLSVKALGAEKAEAPKDEDLKDIPTAMELALRHAMQGTEMGEQLVVDAKASKPARKQDKRNDKHRRQQSDILTRTLQNRVK